jgi:hypothetical protein
MLIILLITNRRFKLYGSKKYLILFFPLIFNFFNFSEILYIDYLLLLLTVLVMSNIDHESVSLMVSTPATIYLSLLSILTFLSYFGIININEITEVGQRVRNTIGFYNTNASGLFLGISIIGLAYTSKNKLLIFSLLLSICIFSMTNTRSIIILIFLGVLYLFSTKYNRIKSSFYYISYIVYFCSFLSPILIHKFLNYEIAGIPINKLASERLVIADSQLSSYSVQQFLFGNFKTFQIDNFFINLLSATGIITYFIISILVFLAIKNNKQNINNLFFILSFLLLGNIESYFSSANVLTIVFLFIITKSNNLNISTNLQINCKD